MGVITKLSLPLLAALTLSACNQEEQSAPAQPPAAKQSAEETVAMKADEAKATQVETSKAQPKAEDLKIVADGLSKETSDSLQKAITMTQGTVRYFNLEGGFWGIVADDGRHILPQNLPQEYRKDGLRLSFKAQEVKDMMTIQQWGILSKLSDIEVIGKVDSKSGDPRL
ncbi:hypothetical protein SHLO109777_12600 [Shewanella loihica]|uniref:Lipoprotein n=1 Tax=Shewanella loihica (strain ATCC BAA-1088 / PV-4) TaxID=323850 RepID=A3QA67_SHELP|nr:hypothetical protein [Shewanella loihica]ABO22365.1 conserved hypothetical protein [Shewanella loihica PV-4]